MEERAEVICLMQYMLNNPDEPIGSGKASQVIEAAGYQVSEATVGRLLRQLDIKGYTDRQGYRGRLLTEQGINFIKQLLGEEMRRRHSIALARQVRSRNKDDLIEILVARRAIEREIARLAAANSSDQQILQMSSLIETYETASTDAVAEGDVAFHELLAEAAGNKVLRAALNLIRQDGQLSPVLGFIRTEVHSRVFADHRKIFEAVKARNPEAAELAMVNHIESLIADVHKYWSRAGQE
ncbi:MAG: FCD domain-containing protein [Firmicutes bacterium]|nr:FCD domain-containing protein [Bacillota bacterium]